MSIADNLLKYINILQEIAKENPEIIQRCGKPPILTGKIDGWIGIGDEPPKKNGKNQSYNSLRADTRNPPVPQAKSAILSPSFGLITFTMKSVTDLGV